MAGPITISVLGDTRDLSSAVRGANGDLTGLGKTSSTMGKVVKAGFFAAAAGAAYGVKKLVDFTKAAAEDEAAQVKLAQTLKKTTGATDAQVAGTENWITKQGELLGVTDDELRPALQRMAEGTHSVKKAQEDVALAMDVSAGTGKSLKSVTEALLRAQNGSIGGLSRYGIATKDAKGETLSLKEVTQGMADTFGGQAAKAADTAAGQYGRLKLIFDETGEAIGAKLLPYATDLSEWALNEGIPAAKDWWRETADTRAELADTAGAIKDDVIPVLKDLGGFVGDLVGFFGNLPGPVRTFGAEAVAAALLLPKLTGALGTAKGAAGGLVTNLRSAETRTTALRNAARMAAGAGGMMLLADAANDAEGPMKELKDTAGKTAVAFAIGGPLLAGVVAFTDIVAGATGAGEDFGLSQEELADQIDRVTQSLNQQTGAYTKRTRNQLVADLGDKGLLESAKAMNVELPELVRATMQGSQGIQRFREKYLMSLPNDQRTKFIALTETLYDMSDALTTGQRGFMLEREAAGKSGRKLQEHRDTVRSLANTYFKLPRQINTIVKSVGADASRKNVRDLAHQYNLTPKQIRTIFAVAGTDKVKGEARDTRRELEDVGKVRGNVNQWIKDVFGGTQDARKKAQDGAKGVRGALEDGPGKARANLAPFGSSLYTGVANLTSRAFDTAAGVGRNIASGVSSGIAANAWQAVNAAGQLVADAIAEANRRGDIHSPSRRTRRTGHELARGVEHGLTDHQKHVRAAAQKLMDNVLEQLNSGISTIKSKLQGLEQARADYIRGIVDAARLPINEAGVLEDSTQTSAGIKEALKDRLADVKNFQAKVQQLVKMGLKGDALKQLLDAGVESGTVTAEALLAGGKTAVADTVKLTDQIAAAAKDLGEIGGKHFYDAGIKSQEALLGGLVADRNKLDNAGRKMGVRLAKAIRKELERGLLDYDRVSKAHHKKRGRLNLDDTHPRRTPIRDRDRAVSVKLTADQVTAIQRGRAVQLDLDAYHHAGGRRRS